MVDAMGVICFFYEQDSHDAPPIAIIQHHAPLRHCTHTHTHKPSGWKRELHKGMKRNIGFLF